MTFTRITIDPAVCSGKPCVRGLKFPVARLLGLLAAGQTREEILKNYPQLEPGDIDEALRYGAFLADNDRRLVGRGRTIRELLDQQGTDEIEFDPPRFGSGIFRTPTLS